MRLYDRLSIYVLCVCLFIGVCITVVLEYSFTRNAWVQARHLTSLMQGQLVHCIDSDLADVARQVRRTARELDFARDILTENNAGTVLRIMIDNDSIIQGGCVAFLPEYAPKRGKEWMLYVDRQPDNSLRDRFLSAPSYPYTTMEWFTKPLQTGTGCWSGPYLDAGGGDLLMVTYSMPMRDREGRIYAVATADVSLRALAGHIADLRPYRDSKSFMTTHDGHVIDPDKGPTQQKAKVDGNNIECSRPLAGLDICVMTVIPEKSVMTLLSSLRLRLLIIMLVGIAMLLIVIRLIITRTTRPLNNLSEAAIEIGHGNFDTRLPKVDSFSELSNLRDAMETMKSSINEYVGKIAEDARHMERIESELSIARRIQLGMLPEPWRQSDCGCGDADNPHCRLSVDAMLRPAREVSGDLFDYIVSGDRLIFAIADVSDKGVPASLVMCQVKSLFRLVAGYLESPARMLSVFNNALAENNPQNMFVTMIIGVIDLSDSTLTLANAGHNPPVLVNDGVATLIRLKPGLPLGVMTDMDYSDRVFPFTGTDMIFLYTDGLTEATGPTGEQYGETRLVDTIRAGINRCAGDAAAMVNAVVHEITGFSDGEPADDITLLCVARIGDGADGHSIESMTFEYDIEDMRRLQPFIERVATQNGWTEAIKMYVSLVAEEALVNILTHSTPSLPDDRARLTIESHPHYICIKLEDSGERFNPLTQAPHADTSSPVETRPVGGLGLFLIRQIADKVEYEYTDHKNKLTISIKRKRNDN